MIVAVSEERKSDGIRTPLVLKSFSDSLQSPYLGYPDRGFPIASSRPGFAKSRLFRRFFRLSGPRGRTQFGRNLKIFGEQRHPLQQI